jgi:hypothetical protein
MPPAALRGAGAGAGGAAAAAGAPRTARQLQRELTMPLPPPPPPPLRGRSPPLDLSVVRAGARRGGSARSGSPATAEHSPPLLRSSVAVTVRAPPRAFAAPPQPAAPAPAPAPAQKAPSPPSARQPLFNLDVEVALGRKERIVVCAGAEPAALAEAFVGAHGLPLAVLGRLEGLIRGSIAAHAKGV